MQMDAWEVEQKLREIREKSGDDPDAAYANAIAYLRLQIELVKEGDDIPFLYHRIAEQHSLYRHVDEEEKVWQEIMNLFPDDPQSWIEASCFYMYERREPEKAVNLAKEGLRVAEVAKRFVIHACNNLCRAAKTKGDYQLMEKTIMSLLSYKRPPGSFDSAYECDFLMRIPEGAVSELLVRRLSALCDKTIRR